MKYVTALLADITYLAHLHAIEELEQSRVYCRHGFTHLMDVARLAWIHNLEESKGLGKEQIYLAALLHDIGRAEEYKTGISHAEAGTRLAGEILLRLGYPDELASEILTAIAGHRAGRNTEHRAAGAAGSPLGELIRQADKVSRACFLCGAGSHCKWAEAKKNGTADWA